ncbi:MAG: Protein GrpE [Candidatus Uhrbacteria bacterium GW2011_GWA2_52_8d]|uniref:Protein GrpE n=1 Tax=Candidatus Uhrbacteria bacterium GW2011_GWA2_52_8d TaxID=1618979 RepID=A0A0G1XPL6_9BACT|nr:MAG: Protein GrpE [Candidatus Uhrbacteria bacterium GW2011_GWA2_52_8d]
MNDEQNISPPDKGGQGGVEPSKCEKCDEYLAGWKRALADYDNLQKDLARERTEIRTRVKQDVAHQLIAVLDNFDQAAKFQPDGLGKELEVWLKGLMHVKSQLEGVTREMGLEAYGAVGEIFSAQLHDAGGERSEEDKADQEILEVVSRGWKLGDRIVRPAKVIINNKH